MLKHFFSYRLQNKKLDDAGTFLLSGGDEKIHVFRQVSST